MSTRLTRHSRKFRAGTQRAVCRVSCLPLPFRRQQKHETNICRLNGGILVLIHHLLNTRESRSGLRDSSTSFQKSSIRCHSGLDLLCNTWHRTQRSPERRCQKHACQVKLKSLFLCWNILLHNVQLSDTTCTDQDGAEERDVVHHELCQWTYGRRPGLCDPLLLHMVCPGVPFAWVPCQDCPGHLCALAARPPDTPRWFAG